MKSFSVGLLSQIEIVRSRLDPPMAPLMSAAEVLGRCCGAGCAGDVRGHVLGLRDIQNVVCEEIGGRFTRK